MALYSVGDVVRIKPISSENWETHYGPSKLWCNKQMGLISQTKDLKCRVKVAKERGPEKEAFYELIALNHSFNEAEGGGHIEIQEHGMGWVWSESWLTPFTDSHTGDAQEEKAEPLDYMGNVIEGDLSDYILLTFPSRHKNTYAKYEDVHEVGMVRIRKYGYTSKLDCEHGSELVPVVVLLSEYEGTVYASDNVEPVRNFMYDFVNVIGGDIVYRPHFNLIEIDAGQYEGQLGYEDDGRWCEGYNSMYHRDDIGFDIFYWDRDGEYHTEQEPGDSRHDYHDGPRHVMEEALFKHGVGFTIGFEVEKESQDELNDFHLDDCDRTLWAREMDSSLCDDSGYEFVSPVFALYGDALEKDKDSGFENPVVRAHINGEYSRSCGGHINLGHSNMCSDAIFDKIQAWIPLLLALYPGRMTRDYSHAKKTIQNYKGGGKYQAVAVRSSVVEFRIFSAVPDVKTLLWRRDLVRIMCEGIEVGTNGPTPMAILRMLTNKKSKLNRHLSKVYSDDKILRITSMYAQFADDLFNTYMLGVKGEGVLFKTFVTTSKRKRVPVEVLLPAVTYGFSRLNDAFSTTDHLQSEALVRQ